MKLPISQTRISQRRFVNLLGEFKGQLTLAVILQVIVVACTVAVPWIIGDVVDMIDEGTTRDVVIWYLGIIIALLIFQSVVNFFSEYVSRVLSEKVFARLRAKLVRGVLSIPQSTIESAGTGDLLGRTTTDIENVRFVVNQGISQFITAVLTVILTYGFAFAASWQLAIVSMILLPVVGVALKRYLVHATPAYRTMNAQWARLNGYVSETTEQARTIDAFSMSGPRNAGYDREVNGMILIERYAAYLRTWLVALMNSMLSIPTLFVVLVGAWLYQYDLVTLGAITTVAFYTVDLQEPLYELSFWIDSMQTVNVSLGRIFGIEDVEPDRHPTGEKPRGESIVSRNVSFSYREGIEVLHDVSLDIKPGETLAIVGPSGAGKSTFGRLIAGVHTPGSGELTVGGVPLVNLNEAELHRHVALVSQEHHMFVGTIRSNLLLAAPEATEAQLWEALDAVEASSWVNALENGIDTEVGSGRTRLNPGQEQQLALARIVLLDPHTLVLDEATSMMDPTAARSLERSLAKVMHGRTVIAIAHRLYTAHDADRVAVMVDGQIAELGTHDELVELGGEYASLWKTWQAE
ncbi:ABC transporter, ATP-binding protein [Gleimia coleocanis DSM 15436]|uniref:ABC transporter, ATP-binding protein n=1 Tax=Gleimia coleocanis DSM 15436 TaxID=525245 RepID=C0W0X5_9ACTO|nr:ABC transporter ATP-binding protein [Gleimia coleocanis]EEH63699.1 ABC transporter, ATP-binding protein [Gleimia coleocanis DSM 15436]